MYFIDPDTGREVWSGIDENFDQTAWIKGKSYQVTSKFSIPSNIPSGTHDLRIAMVDGTGTPRISLGIAGGDLQKRYRIGTVTVSPSSRSKGGRVEGRQNSRMPPTRAGRKAMRAHSRSWDQLCCQSTRSRRRS